MAYVKNTWTSGDIITAEKLNHMEDGIGSGGGVLVIDTQYDEVTGRSTLSLTFREISEALKNNNIALVRLGQGDDTAFYTQFSLVTSIYQEPNTYAIMVDWSNEFFCDGPDEYPHDSGEQ